MWMLLSWALAAEPVAMTVHGVLPTEAGTAVLLTDGQDIVPIFVGEAEALTIALRSTGQTFKRPLTHDLLDAMLRELGGEVVEVRIDDLRDQTFVATLTVKDGERTFKLDARSSDAIAIALGHELPILVAPAVIERARLKEAPVTPERPSVEDVDPEGKKSL